MEGDKLDTSNPKSYSGIPKAVFMSKPENSGGVYKALRSLDEQHAKFKHMKLSATKRRRLRQQISDLGRSLEKD